MSMFGKPKFDAKKLTDACVIPSLSEQMDQARQSMAQSMAMNEAMLNAGPVFVADDLSIKSFNPFSAVSSTAIPKKNPPHVHLESLIMRLRMNVHELADKGVELIAVRKLGDKISVFITSKGTALVLEDDDELYPSDRLVSQVRLML